MSKCSPIETLTINGVDYVRADAVPSPVPLGPVRIVVADKGFVFVGNVEEHADATVTITNTQNIRRWGTKRGLGELVHGPTAATVADPWGTVRCAPILQIAVVGGW